MAVTAVSPSGHEYLPWAETFMLVFSQTLFDQDVSNFLLRLL